MLHSVKYLHSTGQHHLRSCKHNEVVENLLRKVPFAHPVRQWWIRWEKWCSLMHSREQKYSLIEMWQFLCLILQVQEKGSWKSFIGWELILERWTVVSQTLLQSADRMQTSFCRRLCYWMHRMYWCCKRDKVSTATFATSPTWWTDSWMQSDGLIRLPNLITSIIINSS